MSHDDVDACTVTCEVLSIGEFAILGIHLAKHAALVFLTHKCHEAADEQCIKEELVISNTSWQVLLLVDLVVVDSETKSMGQRLE